MRWYILSMCIVSAHFLQLFHVYASQCNRDFNTKSNTIIDREQSELNGAVHLGNHATQSVEDCYELCCKQRDCTTAIYHNKDKHRCFLFYCGHPTLCVFTSNHDYITLIYSPPQSSSSTNRHDATAHNATSREAVMLQQLSESEPSSSHLRTSEEDEHSLTSKLPAHPKPPRRYPHVPFSSSASRPSKDEDISQSQSNEDQQQLTSEEEATNGAVESKSVTMVKLGAHCDWFHHCVTQHAHCTQSRCVCQPGFIEKRGGSCVASVCFKPNLMFQCDDVSKKPACVAVYDQCNGIPECGDGSDEKFCPTESLLPVQRPQLQQTDPHKPSDTYKKGPRKPVSAGQSKSGGVSDVKAKESSQETALHRNRPDPEFPEERRKIVYSNLKSHPAHEGKGGDAGSRKPLPHRPVSTGQQAELELNDLSTGGHPRRKLPAPHRIPQRNPLLSSDSASNFDSSTSFNPPEYSDFYNDYDASRWSPADESGLEGGYGPEYGGSSGKGSNSLPWSHLLLGQDKDFHNKVKTHPRHPTQDHGQQTDVSTSFWGNGLASKFHSPPTAMEPMTDNKAASRDMSKKKTFDQVTVDDDKNGDLSHPPLPKNTAASASSSSATPPTGAGLLQLKSSDLEMLKNSNQQSRLALIVLSVSLVVTVSLLVYSIMRYRNIKKRSSHRRQAVRSGGKNKSPLTTTEEDYLINGMYL